MKEKNFREKKIRLTGRERREGMLKYPILALYNFCYLNIFVVNKT